MRKGGPDRMTHDYKVTAQRPALFALAGTATSRQPHNHLTQRLTHFGRGHADKCLDRIDADAQCAGPRSHQSNSLGSPSPRSILPLGARCRTLFIGGLLSLLCLGWFHTHLTGGRRSPQFQLSLRQALTTPSTTIVQVVMISCIECLTESSAGRITTGQGRSGAPGRVLRLCHFA